jgi:hypothetical protein
VHLRLVQELIDKGGESDSFRSVLEHVAQGSHGSGIAAMGGADGVARLAVGHGNPGTGSVDSCEGDVLGGNFILALTEVVWLRTGRCQ